MLVKHVLASNRIDVAIELVLHKSIVVSRHINRLVKFENVGSDIRILVESHVLCEIDVSDIVEVLKQARTHDIEIGIIVLILHAHLVKTTK